MLVSLLTLNYMHVQHLHTLIPTCLFICMLTLGSCCSCVIAWQLICPFGKNAHIRMISNSVTHLRGLICHTFQNPYPKCRQTPCHWKRQTTELQWTTDWSRPQPLQWPWCHSASDVTLVTSHCRILRELHYLSDNRMFTMLQARNQLQSRQFKFNSKSDCRHWRVTIRQCSDVTHVASPVLNFMRSFIIY